jgi:hypothetical protein
MKRKKRGTPVVAGRAAGLQGQLEENGTDGRS